MLMINNIKNVINKYHMIEQGDKILAGVSGGADSMCLLKVLMTIKDDYNIEILVIHINHQLRGEDSKADEDYVMIFCKEASIKCIVKHADILLAAKDRGWSIEEAGRNIRYELFNEALKEYECDKIAVAHHQEDTAETVLFNMFRGTGLRGMCGIPVVRDNIIRPLIHTSKSAIEEFLTNNDIAWRTDKSNFSDSYTRNKIRNKILSYAKSDINCNASGNIANLSMQMSEVYDYISIKSEEAYKEAVQTFQQDKNGRDLQASSTSYIIDIDTFLTFHSVVRKEVLLKILEKCYGGRKNIESLHILYIEKLLDSQSGKQAVLPGGLTARREFRKIIISFYAMSIPEVKSTVNYQTIPNQDENISIPGLYYLPWLDKTLKLDVINNNSNIIPKNNYTKWFDYDKIGKVVKLRIRKESDSIQINKSGGHKSIKALFIDNKVPISLRDKILLLTSESSVLWVLGVRASEGYYVDDKTKRILTAEIV